MSKRKSGRSPFVRVMALLLALVMIAGVAYYLIMLIGGNI